MQHLFKKLREDVLKWREGGYPCQDYSLIGGGATLGTRCVGKLATISNSIWKKWDWLFANSQGTLSKLTSEAIGEYRSGQTQET